MERLKLSKNIQSKNNEYILSIWKKIICSYWCIFQKTKVVLLEELACQFGLRTQDAIERLQSLQEMERITGTGLSNVKNLSTDVYEYMGYTTAKTM